MRPLIDTPAVQARKPMPCVIARGDGIGPEIMDAVLFVLREAGAAIETHDVEIGERVYDRGVSSGIEDRTLQTLADTGVLLKAPVTTPQGGGFKSLNVTLRKMFGLFANIRPARALSPFVQTLHPGMDIVIVRENEEDVYGGIEHRQTDDVTQCLKLISRSGTERIVRYAFEYARLTGRERVTCFSKDNIMKITDGLFHRVFTEIAAQYPDIEPEHMIVDIGAAKLAVNPERFDVIVVPNLYGDILSDVAAELCGSIGLTGSANIGERFAMFEAIHGSAPDIAGRGIANPSGLLNAAVMMLGYVGKGDLGQIIQNAWLCTLEDGMHTRDIFGPSSRRCLSTMEFARTIVESLGREPRELRSSQPERRIELSFPATPRQQKVRVGVDVFFDWDGTASELAHQIALAATPLPLKMITNRGTQVWPRMSELTRCVDHWRCRFESAQPFAAESMLETLYALHNANLDIIKTEGLFRFDGVAGYSMGQGQ